MADFEDSQEKLRRNLVALSAAILASGVFRPKLADEGKILGFIDAGDVDPFRVWVLITMALSYFACRYWLSRQRTEAWLEWRSGKNEKLGMLLQDELKKGAAKIVGEIWGSDPVEPIPEIRLFSFKLVNTLDIRSDHRSGVAHLTWDFAEGGEQYEEELDYDFRGRESTFSQRKAILHAVLFSQGTFELFVPLVLAASAFVACACAVVRHWPCHS